MPHFTYRPNKRRSGAQKSPISSLYARLSAVSAQDQPNEPSDVTYIAASCPVMEPDHLLRTKNQLKLAQARLKVAQQREKRTRSKLLSLKSELKATQEELSLLQAKFSVQEANFKVKIAYFDNAMTQTRTMLTESGTRINSLEHTNASLEAEMTQLLDHVVDEVEAAKNRIQKLLKRNHTLQQDWDALRKRRARKSYPHHTDRLSTTSKTEIPQKLMLKNGSGTIRAEIRNLLCDLVAEGVSTKHIMPVICYVTGAFGLEVVDSISARSVSRAVLEGFLESEMQIGYEINQAEHISICGDGTSIKNQQYEAQLMRVPVHPPSKAGTTDEDQTQNILTTKLLSLGVHMAPNHTALGQMNGWRETVEPCVQLLNDSPMGQGMTIDSRVFEAKIGRILSDHASDQKRLVELFRDRKYRFDRAMRGEEVFGQLSDDEQNQALSDQLETARHHLGNWEQLSDEQKGQAKAEARSSLMIALGEEAFKALTDEEKDSIDLFLWTGCAMHKELNAVKGGVAAMSHVWEDFDLIPPISLYNKYEASNALEDQDHTSASKRDLNRGAVKLTSLAGAIFNHKDDKKGQQDVYKHFFEHICGYRISFPDTSNTRYGSHCAAAIELLVNRKIYLQFLESVRDCKSVLGFTNIEKNVYNGLHDPPTLTELATLALYAQAVGTPVMGRVRSGHQNALDLRVFYEQVKSHCRTIIDNPCLLLDPDMSSGTGTLDGRSWDRPDVVYCISSMSNMLPHLEDVLVAFFRGALETWERFTSEFAPDSAIAQASAELRSKVWNSPTNDASEGALGQCRQELRHRPSLTDNQRNARVMRVHNNTYQFVLEHFTDEDYAYVRRMARIKDASGDNQRVREEMNRARMDQIEANRAKQTKAVKKRTANEQRLAEVQILEGATQQQLEKLTVRQLDEQIDKLRKTDTELPVKSRIGNKKAKVLAVLEALDRLSAALTVPEPFDKVANKTIDEYCAFDAREEGAPQDEEMLFRDEVAV